MVFVLTILAAVVLGGVAIGIDTLTSSVQVGPGRVFWVGPSFLLAAGAGLFLYTGVISRATTGGAIPMVVLAAIHIPFCCYLLKRDFMDTVAFLAMWVVASAILLSILIIPFRPLLVS
ncbi:hypothetical protein H8D30_04760 [bacterium]|nr:hypothetical protein [bacterium]